MFQSLRLFIFTILFVTFFAAIAFAGQSEDKVWREIDDANLKNRPLERLIVPNEYKTFKLSKSDLDNIINDAPKEFSQSAKDTEIILSLPLPDGTFSRFRIQNSPIMETELAAKYPQINSYVGQGIDVPNATTRFDISPNGFRAIILSHQGTVFIEPYAKGDTANYISFNKQNISRNGDEFICEFNNQNIWQGKDEDIFNVAGNVRTVTNGTTLRTYRLALAVTGEYTNIFRQSGDTDAQAKVRALAAMNTSMNRVNGVYERDVAVRMILIANTDLLIYTDPATDPYANTSGDLNANQTNIDTVIGTANYDIGHLFGTGGGGVANLNSPCGGSKARGLTGRGNPQGDPFDIDYVAHEIGHQFGGLHTFNGAVSNCSGGNRSSSAAYEPGSGITIMAYAGICGNQNLAPNSIDTFHVKSLEQIVQFINGGGNCSANTPTNNTPPAVPTASASSFNIPKQTPFSLNATTTDANNDAITYDWHEFDLSTSTTAVPNSDSDNNPRPIFRPYLPKTNGTIYFPSLQYILNNANVPPSTYTCGAGTCLTGELLPAIARTMNFQVVARDNRASGGGINTATVQVIVDAASGPFNVTAPNTAISWAGGSSQTITWNVANTTNAPVSAANVRILLSTDGGQTFPTVISTSTLNDGTQTITVPNVNTTTARIKVEGEGKIFFDISDTNFTITSSVAPTKHLFDFDGDNKDDVSVYRSGNWYLQRSTAGFLGIPFGLANDKLVAADYDGDNKTDTAVFRASAVDGEADYFVLLTNGFVLQGVAWGTTGDIPIVGDYDGDNKFDYTVYRNGNWYILSATGTVRSEVFGLPTDKIVIGDYDGDNKSDLAVYRGGSWYIQQSTAGFVAYQFGLSTDIPVPADYDGDAKTDIAVYRNGSWYVLGSQTGFAAYQFGLSTDIPTPADYDGDNKADVTVFRPSDGIWYQLRTTSGFAAIPFGLNGDKPIPSQNN